MEILKKLRIENFLSVSRSFVFLVLSLSASSGARLTQTRIAWLILIATICTVTIVGFNTVWLALFQQVRRGGLTRLIERLAAAAVQLIVQTIQ